MTDELTLGYDRKWLLKLFGLPLLVPLLWLPGFIVGSRSTGDWLLVLTYSVAIGILLVAYARGRVLVRMDSERILAFSAMPIRWDEVDAIKVVLNGPSPMLVFVPTTAVGSFTARFGRLVQGRCRKNEEEYGSALVLTEQGTNFRIDNITADIERLSGHKIQR